MIIIWGQWNFCRRDRNYNLYHLIFCCSKKSQKVCDHWYSINSQTSSKPCSYRVSLDYYDLLFPHFLNCFVQLVCIGIYVDAQINRQTGTLDGRTDRKCCPILSWWCFVLQICAPPVSSLYRFGILLVVVVKNVVGWQQLLLLLAGLWSVYHY